jgi:hypothetical protein
MPDVELGAQATELNFTDDLPAIPSGKQGVKWQVGDAYPDPNNTAASVRNASAYVDSSSGGIDHVVMSVGIDPPQPLHDGAGHFIYVGYTP